MGERGIQTQIQSKFSMRNSNWGVAERNPNSDPKSKFSMRSFNGGWGEKFQWVPGAGGRIRTQIETKFSTGHGKFQFGFGWGGG